MVLVVEVGSVYGSLGGLSWMGSASGIEMGMFGMRGGEVPRWDIGALIGWRTLLGRI